MKKKLSFGYKAFVMVLFAFILWNGSMVTVGAKKTTNSSNSKSEQQLTESEKSLEDLPEKIQEVIAGKRRFIDATDGKKYTLSSGFEKVEPTKIKSGNNYYIALNKDVLDAETITLIIKIRNKTYEYKIK